MRVVSKAKRQIAIILAVVAIGAATAGCLPDNQGAIGPDNPTNNQVFQELNARRRSAGLPEFGYSPKLGLDAQVWAALMSQGTGLHHQNLNALLDKPDHGAFWTLGENIAVGPWYMNGSIIVNLFMGSPPHRANILNGGFNVVGIGSSSSADGQLWVSLVFGGL